MNRKFLFFYVIAPVLLAVLFFTFEGFAKRNDDRVFKQGEVLAQVRRLILDRYVQEVEEKEVYENALHGMVRGLDAHCRYLDAETLQQMEADSDGEFGGLGIQVSMQNEYITVISPISGSPAARAGILPGDRILEIEGQSTEDYTLSDAVRILRGKPGTKVTITIIHRGASKSLKVTLTRAIIQVKSIKFARIVDTRHGIATLLLTSFQETTASELLKAMKKLDKQGMKSLVLDLRGNPGGLLRQSQLVTDTFIEKGVIVSIRGRLKDSAQVLEATAEGTWSKLPMVVLINSGSASASEIVAGALQDHRRALIVGERSYGKGSVQNIIRLGDYKTALKLTTAYYYTPAGRNINRTKKNRGGIEPDIAVKFSLQDWKDYAEIRRRLSIKSNVKDSKKPKDKRQLRDRQLDQAVELLRGKRVYDKLPLKAKKSGKR